MMTATVRSRGMMYKAVDQSVLLYVNKSWVLTGGILNSLEGFHHRVDRQITGTTAEYREGGEWEYPPLVVELESVVPHPIMDYIRRRHATIAEKVECRPIYEI